MSLVPGASGQKSVFPDGVQVDHLSENTVGHGVRVKGISDPTTYPVIAGDVGERITWVSEPIDSPLITSATYTDWANAYITLSKGRWELKAVLPAVATSGNVANDITNTIAAVTDSAGTIVPGMIGNATSFASTSTTYIVGASVTLMGVVDVTQDGSVYKIRLKANLTGGRGSGKMYNGADGKSVFYAVRIA